LSPEDAALRRSVEVINLAKILYLKKKSLNKLIPISMGTSLYLDLLVTSSLAILIQN
jgi:hypothetical protein